MLPLGISLLDWVDVAALGGAGWPASRDVWPDQPATPTGGEGSMPSRSLGSRSLACQYSSFVQYPRLDSNQRPTD